MIDADYRGQTDFIVKAVLALKHLDLDALHYEQLRREDNQGPAGDLLRAVTAAVAAAERLEAQP